MLLFNNAPAQITKTTEKWLESPFVSCLAWSESRFESYREYLVLQY